MTDQKVMELAIGRILRMGSRPTQPGDVEEYNRCRGLILDAAERLGMSTSVPSIGTLRPGWNFGNSVLE